jgi:hypothetical protein
MDALEQHFHQVFSTSSEVGIEQQNVLVFAVVRAREGRILSALRGRKVLHGAK